MIELCIHSMVFDNSTRRCRR